MAEPGGTRALEKGGNYINMTERGGNDRAEMGPGGN